MHHQDSLQHPSRFSTIQGVESYPQDHMSLIQQQQCFYADPISMLSSQHMAHMMGDHSHLENKQEPTIMSDTLN